MFRRDALRRRIQRSSPKRAGGIRLGQAQSRRLGKHPADPIEAQFTTQIDPRHPLLNADR